MSISTVLVPIVSGVIVVAVLFFLGYGIWMVL
jgi:hypothetical protein